MKILAADYDGTLATLGRIEAPTLAALRSLVAAGGRAILVTGRRLDDLRVVCPHLDVFARVVAENGALLHRPDTNETRLLADRPPRALVDRLRARGIDPIDAGEVIVATLSPHDRTVEETIRALRLPLHVVRNKHSLMILPIGTSKGSGLRAALDDLRLDARDVVGVGDAENDHALLAGCGLGVAVANATESLRARADLVTRCAEGRGVVELIESMLRDELRPRIDQRSFAAAAGGIDAARKRSPERA